MESKQKILKYCFWLLSKRDYCVSEIRKKLQKHEYEESEIEKTISFLLENDFLNDKRFVENYLRIHPSRGKIRIKFELIRKGVGSELVEEILSTINSDDQFTEALELAKNWWRKNFKPDSDKYKLKQKLMAKLSRQGFEYPVISNVVDELLK